MRRRSADLRPALRVGVDTGGTFTDLFALWDGGSCALKVPSTPGDPAQAVLDALRRLREVEPGLEGARITLVHGSTVATNALLEGRGARVVLVTNAGFEDLLEIGRQARRDLYSLEPERPTPWVAREDRFGIEQRTTAQGERIVSPTAMQLRALADRVRRSGAEAVAVGLLHAWKDGGPEEEVQRALESLRLPICTSAAVAPSFREYERFSTTVANAKLLPLLEGYLRRLEREAPCEELLVQQSNGGLSNVEEAAQRPVRLVLSGPAGGLFGAQRWLETAKVPRAITFDMGGTSTDVGLVLGRAQRTDRVEVDARPLLVESLDLTTIGAGGGSLVWIDEGGALRVGPRSAGADPGPACYGRGEAPTVSDAHALLGRLVVDRALGGRIELDASRSVRAFAPIARALHCSVEEAAARVLDIADAHMERALRRVTLERGHDPRRFALFSFGGAGGLHACRLAARLGLCEVVVPPAPGALSAFGMAVADPCFDESRSFLALLDAAGLRGARTLASKMRRTLERRLRDAFGAGQADAEVELRLRFVGQSYELGVPFGEDFRERFLEEHRRLYGFALDPAAIECVTVHVRVSRTLSTPAPRTRTARARTAAPPRVRAWFPMRPAGALTSTLGRARNVPRHLRDELRAGQVVVGPAFVVESTATLVVEPGFEARLDRAGCLRVVAQRRGAIRTQPPSRSTRTSKAPRKS